MDSRRRNRKVTILHLVDGQDAIGQPLQNWTTLVAVWAHIRFLNGTESIKAGAQAAVAQASIRLGYRAGITTAMRLQHGATVYEITAVLPDEARREFVDLACKVIA